MPFERKCGGAERIREYRYLEEGIPGRKNCKCKSPEVTIPGIFEELKEVNVLKQSEYRETSMRQRNRGGEGRRRARK